MKTIIKKIRSGEYDKHNKRTFFVDIQYSDPDIFNDISVDYTLSFYDEENLNFNKSDIDHIRTFITPLIKEKISREYETLLELLNNKANNGQ
jgi:hypothetical protein